MMDRRMVLAGLGLTIAAPLRAAPARLPAGLAGAFVPWVGSQGREPNMAAWEAWLGRPASSVPALDYWGKDDWAAFAGSAWLPGFWARAAPRRPVVWSIPLTVPGTPLAAVAAGRHDAAFSDAAAAIAAVQPTAVIRLGWEMNVGTMAWFAGSDRAAYVAAHRRVAALFRTASGRFRLDWCPSWGPEDIPADQCYPGDDVVDVIGLDTYDYRVGSETVEGRWSDRVVSGPFGLAWLEAFARARRKPMSLPEWGVGEAGDNPYFVAAMSRWMADHASSLLYACYFDVDGLWPTRLTGDQFPASHEGFHRAFSL